MHYGMTWRPNVGKLTHEYLHVELSARTGFGADAIASFIAIGPSAGNVSYAATLPWQQTNSLSCQRQRQTEAGLGRIRKENVRHRDGGSA